MGSPFRIGRRGSAGPRRPAPRRAACRPPPSPGARARPSANRFEGSSIASSEPSSAYALSTRPVADPADALVVARAHRLVPRPEDRLEPRPGPHVDRVLREDAERLAVALVPDLLREVLDEVAAAQDVEQLEAAADRERRQVALERRLEERAAPPRRGGPAPGRSTGAARRRSGPGRCRCRPRRRSRRARRASPRSPPRSAARRAPGRRPARRSRRSREVRARPAAPTHPTARAARRR